MYEVFIAVKQVSTFLEAVDIDQIVRSRVEELERCGVLHRLQVHGDDYTTIYIIDIIELIKTPSDILSSRQINAGAISANTLL